MFRENPTDITFPEAVNLFSARSRFVREGSKSCMVSCHSHSESPNIITDLSIYAKIISTLPVLVHELLALYS